MNDESTVSPSEYAILYVDDEEMALKYFRRALGHDFTVHIATDSGTGLDILEAHGDTIGVLISDQRMPGTSGVELLKAVRKRWPHIIRVLTTAYADLDDAIEAVNRGEIFRYITKPWDVDTLRTEVGQAMELFRLRHERAELIREKMGVWQRLVQLGRLRDLVVMSGSVTHLRHSENAVARYLADHLSAPDGSSLAASQYLDLWQLTEAEISRTLTFVGDALSPTAGITNRNEPFETSLSAAGLRKLIADAFVEVHCADDDRLPAIRVAEGLVTIMFEALASAAGHPAGGVTLRPASAGTAVSLAVPCTAVPTDSGLTAGPAAQLLTAYLLAFHHGGELERQSAGNQDGYVMTLPADPMETVATPLPSGWLEPLLVRLEGWD